VKLIKYLMAAAFAVTSSIVVADIPGLTVRDGLLVKCANEQTCAPVHLYGVNYYDAMWRNLNYTQDLSYQTGFSELKRMGVKVARVPLMAYWPIQHNLFFNNRVEYWKRVDALLATAEANNVGLIVSWMWEIWEIGEMVPFAVKAGYLVPGVDFVPANNKDKDGLPTTAEYRGDLDRADSGSVALMRKLTREFVTRYVDHPAILGWEFGNEASNQLHVSIQTMRTRPGSKTGQGMVLPNTDFTLPVHTGIDDTTAAIMEYFKGEWAKEVRAIDDYRFLMTGDSLPRTSAWNNEFNRRWLPDTLANSLEILDMYNPDPIDTVTLHVYTDKAYTNSLSYYWATERKTNKIVSDPNVAQNLYILINQYKQFATTLGKPLIIGEFGSQGDGTTELERLGWNAIIRALMDNDVQLALLWAFDTHDTSMVSTYGFNNGANVKWPRTPKMDFMDNCNNPDKASLVDAIRLFSGKECGE
jgi:hypothetical protein